MQESQFQRKQVAHQWEISSGKKRERLCSLDSNATGDIWLRCTNIVETIPASISNRLRRTAKHASMRSHCTQI